MCTRGRIHIFKFLEIEAVKEDRKRGILEGGGDCGGRRLSRKPSNLPDTGRFLSNDARRRRFTFDNGFPTSDPTADQRWPRNDTTSEHHSTTTNGNAAAVVAVTSQTAPTTASSMSSHQSPKVYHPQFRCSYLFHLYFVVFVLSSYQLWFSIHHHEQLLLFWISVSTWLEFWTIFGTRPFFVTID